MKRERFSARLFFKRDSFPDNCIDSANGNVSFGARNNECLSKKRDTFCSRGVYVDKINHIFQGCGSLVSLRLQKDTRAKSQQIWTNLSHWNTDGLSSRCEDLFEDLLLFFKSSCDRSVGFCTLCFYFPTKMLHLNAPFFPLKCSVFPKNVTKMLG